MKIILAALSMLVALSGSSRAQTPAAQQAGINAFNRDLDQATRSMNSAATLALWEDGGVSLLPSTKPIVGKQAIGKFIDDVLTQLKGARMQKYEQKCFDITVSGDWASEWCLEHQVVDLGAGKPPFDGWGKMLFILHKGADGKWRLTHEMWNQALPAEMQ